MEIPIYQVNAFTNKLLHGNPAAVCPLKNWLPDDLLQKIAKENNLSETAFYVKEKEEYALRWFTPEVEVDLCGHATLATAYILMKIKKEGEEILFTTKSGPLKASLDKEGIALFFPAKPPVPCPTPSFLVEALKEEPLEIREAGNYLVIYEKEETVRDLRPAMDLLKKVDSHGVIVTARGNEVDFVSRYFAPRVGIDEDPVTGSAHCTLIPYWSHVLKKDRMIARQISSRGGEILCENKGERVKITGEAFVYLKGHIFP